MGLRSTYIRSGRVTCCKGGKLLPLSRTLQVLIRSVGWELSEAPAPSSGFISVSQAVDSQS